MEHHCLVSYLALGPNIEAERTIVVLFGLIIPFESTNADLEGDELIDGSPELLILLLGRVVLAWLLLHVRKAARELCVNCYKVCLLYAVHDERQRLREILLGDLHCVYFIEFLKLSAY